MTEKIISKIYENGSMDYRGYRYVINYDTNEIRRAKLEEVKSMYVGEDEIVWSTVAYA